MEPKGYVLVRRKVVDPELAAEYLQLSAAALAEAGGRFLVRGAVAEVKEGDPDPEGAAWVVIEFDTVQAARDYYDSAAYARPRELAAEAFERSYLVVEGVPVS
ncbi:DUF1330 domain-containing protein [Auraticoccus sp. F435]|uniref:DUF1330 domain-containing protein n=1 Tax=Auraticoccus cholistanensis TaxID=2656650 RepID=A0A6A9V274_9ACTN|nr:DUF1330 domain-containing protein [Auraticoccus cholistanensis]MVA77693.1 DUF1330 domain-containing protein [Auraticoccus cholistanensis]